MVKRWLYRFQGGTCQELNFATEAAQGTDIVEAVLRPPTFIAHEGRSPIPELKDASTPDWGFSESEGRPHEADAQKLKNGDIKTHIFSVNL